MFIHWSKQINAEELGKRLARVECSNCSCEYYYTLIRIGAGSATAHYSMGVARATRSAQKQAKDELNGRLNSEAEPVPCPKCFWINEELVQGYRLGRYRSAGGYALLFAIVGVCIPLVYACLYYADPAVARGTLSHYLAGGTTLFWLIALAIIGIRNVLRSRIQPNRHFPLPPKLPPGIPTAFLLDPAGGELVPAISHVPQDEFKTGWIDFRIGNDHMPMLCCDCLEQAPAGLGHKSQLTSTMQLEIPRCGVCAHLARRIYWRIWFTIAASGALLTATVVGLMKLSPPELWIVVGGACVLFLCLASYLASSAIVPVNVRTQDRSRGIVRLRFRNPEYASEVAKHLSTL